VSLVTLVTIILAKLQFQTVNDEKQKITSYIEVCKVFSSI